MSTGVDAAVFAQLQVDLTATVGHGILLSLLRVRGPFIEYTRRELSTGYRIATDIGLE